MVSRSLARAVVLGIFAAVFLTGGLGYPIGELSRPGPGLFPIVVSSLLLVIATVMGFEARGNSAEALHFNIKNIAIVLAALIAFVIAARSVGGAIAIILLVFISAIAGRDYSWKRNAVVVAVLIVVALAFQKLLDLPLRVM